MRVVDIAFDANTPESFHAGVNAHRRLVTRYKLPRASKGSGEPMGALVASWSWIGWSDGPSLADQLWHVWAVKNSSSVEAYWLDAGWFWGGFPAGVGNWQLPISGAVNTSKFPGGTLAPLGVAAHAEPNPVQFIVWFEPERVAKGTWIDMHHPEFLLQAGGSSSKLLNLGNAVARDFITTYLSSAVGNYSLDVLRLDFNFDPAPFWAAGDVMQGNRSGITELAYVEGLYHMWDTCMEEHPGLLIDDCSSGGRRIDLETLSRSVPLWRSDNPGTSEQQQVQSMGLSGFAPISSGGVSSWLPYPWRSSGIVGKTIDWGRAGWEVLLNDTSEMTLLRAAVAETQRLRPLAIFGDYYPLTPIAQGGPWGWAAYQLHCPRDAPPGTCAAGAGFAYVFLRPTGPPFGSFVANLFSIEPAAACVATLRYGYSVNATLRVTGTQLAALNITFPGGTTSESVLLEYTCATEIRRV
jgi:alpha-galactosidase